MVLTTNSSITAADGDITFSSTVNSDSNASPKALIVNAGTYDVVLSGSVGSINALANTSISGASITATDMTLEGTLSVSNSAASSITGVIGLNVTNMVKTGAGTLTLSGVNTYTGTTTISEGTLSVATIGDGGVAGNLGAATNTATNLVLNGGGLQYTGLSASTNRNFILSNATTSTIDVSTNTLSLTGSSTVTTGGLTKAGSGTLMLLSANTYTGLTSITNGSLAYGINNALASGAVTINGSSAIWSLAGYSDTVGAVTLIDGSIIGSSSVLTATNYNVQNGSISAILQGDIGLTKTTSGTVILSEANTYTGITTISEGVLQIGNGGPIGSISGDVVNNGALVFNRSDALGYVGVISGSGTLSKAGAGTLTLSGANSYEGITYISAGTLAVSGSLSDLTQVLVASGATYRVDVSDTVGSIEGAGNITTGAASGTVSLTVNMDTSLTKIFSGVMSNGSNAILDFTKSGLGSLTISGNNTYTGGTILSEGILALGASNRLADSGLLTITGGTFSMSAFNETVAALNMTGGSITGTGILSSASYTINTPTNTTLTLTTVISGGTKLIKLGDGTLVLTANNIYTGGTDISAGTLNLGSANAISTLGTISFLGGTLQFTSVNTTDYSARFATTANQAYSFDTNSQNIVFSSVLNSSNSTLTKLGAGTLTMSNASSFVSSTIGILSLIHI